MRMVELFTTGPAGCAAAARRDAWQPGAPGDVTLFDTESQWDYDVNKSFSRSRNSPFDGHRFKGGPVGDHRGGFHCVAPGR